MVIPTLMLAAVGWCEDSRLSEALCGVAEQGGLTLGVGAGFGRGTMFYGSVGYSPGLNLGSLGIAQGNTNAARLKYDPVEFQGMGLAFTWDYYYNMANGSSYYDGPANPEIHQGDTVDSQFFVTINSINLDFNAAPLVSGGKWLAAGPRLQYTTYADTLQTSDANIGRDIKGSKNYGMVGLGAWGAFDLAVMSGLNWATEHAVIKPRLNVGVSYGTGRGMRYWEWEAFLQVLKVGGNLYTSRAVTVGPLAVELGYAKYYFTETDRQAGPFPFTDEGNIRMSVGIPLIRGTLPLSF